MPARPALLALALLPLTLFPLQASGAVGTTCELDFRTDAHAGPAHADATVAPACAQGVAAAWPAGAGVLLTWWHDEAGVTGLTLALDGAGLDGVALPLEATTYGGTLGEARWRYDSPRFTPTQAGTLTATLLRDGVPVASATATVVG